MGGTKREGGERRREDAFQPQVNSINNNDCSNNNTLSPSTSSGCLVSVIKWPHDLLPLRGLTRCALRDGFPQTLVVKNDD